MNAVPQPEIDYQEYLGHGACDHCGRVGPVWIRERIEDGVIVSLESALCQQCVDS